MPQTKLSKLVETEFNKPQKERHSLTLSEVPDLPVTLTIEKAAELAGVGYQAIKSMVEGEQPTIPSIKTGVKRVIPTWEFLRILQIFPEPMLEKVFMQRLEWERLDREARMRPAANA